MSTQYRTSLTELLGKDVETKVKAHFFMRLQEALVEYENRVGLPITPDAERLIMLAYEAGFNHYHNLVYAAAKRGDITISITDGEGTTWHFTPT